ncbi:MAG: SDR family oxidoreductase, partial [Erysipelotrichaceae bacterium]|nr:SDR family oxidoreductase [Erysipelotrichaceae bacterium]
FGSIVNLSSDRANVADGTHLLYSTAKGGIAAMTRELAFTLGKDNIRVNAVLPGYIHTDMTDHYLHQKGMKEHILYHSALPNLLTAEDVARVIYFLCDTENTAISGQCIAVDAGMNVFAGGINKEETK